MKVLIDINHVAHLNFFKPVIKKIQKAGYPLYISYLKRGRLEEIINKELPDIQKSRSGIHRGTKFSIIFEANILKFFSQLFFIYQNNIDIGLSCGGFVNGAVFKLLLRPNIQFDDDPERKKNVFLEKLTATKLFFPPVIQSNSNKIHLYNALKEWAYLSPDYFSPHKNVLNNLLLEPKNYIFVREISTGSLNYMSQEKNIILSIARKLIQNERVVLSLEDKSKKHLYPEEWILLKEPVEDIHSLIYYSKLIISSGDSMAREGALLGIPAIYCGTRQMKANEILIHKNRLFHVKVSEVPALIRQINNQYGSIWQDQELFRQALLKEWDDVPEFILGIINEFNK